MPIHPKTVGVLGGGQLAQMLVMKARQMGLRTIVLASKRSDPAVASATRWIQGEITSEQDIRALIRLSDYITFESEFIPAQLLKKSLKQITGKKIYPSLKCLGNIQDRLRQKEWLCDYDLPTLDHIKINSKDDIELAFKVFKQKVVFKRRMGGYDGNGTFVVKNKLELDHFKKQFKGLESQFIIEPYVEFKSEKSLIFARNTKGEIVVLPMIDSVQKNNQCDYVTGPTSHPQEKAITVKIKSFITAIDYVGVIAFELFDLGKKLVINEVAPRVHNTGHFSQDALSIDQFELHLRCILGMSLPTPQLRHPDFVMVNLLGTSTRKPAVKKYPSGALHWYDKQENRPRRKMGHINYSGRNKKELLKMALLERKGILL
ncbi:MAG: 5-(carboxyamino)imidazole ribonucleotide synthase [Bdellovibrionaceae bacterium]|nr:5-(carboxyamino)imidazole ribonucleotide synthase [Bdellovibrio sp.]